MAETKKRYQLGIIGWPLGYSLSPAMHNAALKAAGLSGEYREIPVKPEALEGWLEREAPKLDGFNVTMPHKEAVCAWLKQHGRVRNSRDQRMGAVNAVRVEQGRLVGCNTDGDGFLRLLDRTSDSSRLFDERSEKKVVLLGAGGAARAIAFSLAASGVGEIRIWNRHRERAQALADDLAPYAKGNAACHSSVLEAVDAAALKGVDLLVQTTPAGMKGKEPLPCDIPFDLLEKLDRAAKPSKKPVLCDIVYDPKETPFLLRAKEHGLTFVGGLGMLIEQAALSFEFWFGDVVPKEKLRRISLVMGHAIGDSI